MPRSFYDNKAIKLIASVQLDPAYYKPQHTAQEHANNVGKFLPFSPSKYQERLSEMIPLTADSAITGPVCTKGDKERCYKSIYRVDAIYQLKNEKVRKKSSTWRSPSPVKNGDTKKSAADASKLDKYKLEYLPDGSLAVHEFAKPLVDMHFTDVVSKFKPRFRRRTGHT
jgi:hypothetical protein